MGGHSKRWESRFEFSGPCWRGSDLILHCRSFIWNLSRWSQKQFDDNRGQTNIDLSNLWLTSPPDELNNTLGVYFQDQNSNFAEFSIIHSHSLLHTLVHCSDLMLQWRHSSLSSTIRMKPQLINYAVQVGGWVTLTELPYTDDSDGSPLCGRTEH